MCEYSYDVLCALKSNSNVDVERDEDARNFRVRIFAAVGNEQNEVRSRKWKRPTSVSHGNTQSGCQARDAINARHF